MTMSLLRYFCTRVSKALTGRWTRIISKSAKSWDRYRFAEKTLHISQKISEELQEDVGYQRPIFIQPTYHEPRISGGTSTVVDGV